MKYDTKVPYWQDLVNVINDVDSRLEALETVSETEALRTEIDELRKELDDERGHRKRIERALEGYLHAAVDGDFQARVIARQLLQGN